MGDVTRIINLLRRGEADEADELPALLYYELRQIAAHRMSLESPGHTLQPTALVHEAWLRLFKSETSVPFANRRHFYAAAAEAMRRVLVGSARRKRRIKHGGHLERCDIDEVEIAAPMPDVEILELDEALDRLAMAHSPLG